MLEGKEIQGKFDGDKGQYAIDITGDGKVEFTVAYAIEIGAAARKLADSSQNSLVKKVASLIAGAFGK